MEFKMQLEGKILDKIKVASNVTRRFFVDAMRDASTLVMENIIRETPASTGNLRKAMRREISGSGLSAEIFPSVVYGEALHGSFDESDGAFTAPHTIPAREAQPGGSLYRWAKKKGMNPWAVRASIAKRGVKRNRYMKRGSENASDGVGRIFEGALDKVAVALGD